MSPNRSLEHLAQIAEKHLTIKQQRDLYYRLVGANPRLINWLGSVPSNKTFLSYLYLGAEWLKVGFQDLAEHGQETNPEDEHRELAGVIRNNLRPQMTDRAIRMQLRRFAGLLTNCASLPFDGGHVVIECPKNARKMPPFDFAVISDNADGFEVSAIIVGHMDDGPEQIIAKIENRLLSFGGIEAAEGEVLNAVADIHLNDVRNRSRVSFWYLGGDEYRFDDNITVEEEDIELYEYEGVRIIPFAEFLDDLEEPGHDYQTYLEHDNGPDPYETSTRVEDGALNNARFWAFRGTVLLDDWRFALRFMQGHHRLIQTNLEITLAIQYASPLEANVKLPGEVWYSP